MLFKTKSNLMRDYTEFTQADSLEQVENEIKQNDAVLLYFYNDNCSPCISLRPKIIEMAEEKFPKIKLIFINSIRREIPAKFGVFDNPSLLVFFDSKEYIRKSKYVSIAELEQETDRYYNMIF